MKGESKDSCILIFLYLYLPNKSVQFHVNFTCQNFCQNALCQYMAILQHSNFWQSIGAVPLKNAVYDLLCMYLGNTMFICYTHMHKMCILCTVLGYIVEAVENIINNGLLCEYEIPY